MVDLFATISAGAKRFQVENEKMAKDYYDVTKEIILNPQNVEPNVTKIEELIDKANRFYGGWLDYFQQAIMEMDNYINQYPMETFSIEEQKKISYIVGVIQAHVLTIMERLSELDELSALVSEYRKR